MMAGVVTLAAVVGLTSVEEAELLGTAYELITGVDELDTPYELTTGVVAL